MRILVLVGVLVASNAWAQVSPDRIAQIAQAVHDAERWDLGAGSTRETRNEFWARVMGIVHFGHPVYNATPDPSWCLKDGGGGRPQTDDVATKCATREFWDCIGGVGAANYRFGCNGHGGERLPSNQNVYPPQRPRDSGVVPPVTPPAPPPAVDLRPLLDALARVEQKLDALAARPVPSLDLSSVTGRLDAVSAQVDEARKDIQALASKPITVDWPEYSGRVLGTGVTLRPRQ